MPAIGSSIKRLRPSSSQLAQRNSRACQRSSICRPCDGLNTIPARWKNFNPLYLAGLCEAEIWMPPAASSDEPASRSSVSPSARQPARRAPSP